MGVERSNVSLKIKERQKGLWHKKTGLRLCKPVWAILDSN